MDENKTDEVYFDLAQESFEKDEKSKGRREDVDRGDEVTCSSCSSKESVYFSCDETDEGRTAECGTANEEGMHKTMDIGKRDDVTNTVVEDPEANDASPKSIEETREPSISYEVGVRYGTPQESCWTIVKKNLLDCLCCCCSPSSCGACNTRIRQQQASDFVSVPQCCATRPPGGKVKIAMAPGKTIITPYMASLGIISLEAYMELEAQKRARESTTATQANKKAEREAEFMQLIEEITPKRVEVVKEVDENAKENDAAQKRIEVVENNNTNENAEANGVTPKRVGRMKRFRRFLQRVFCCSGRRED